MSEKLENIELRSEEVQQILTKVPNWMIRWGNTLFLILILLLVSLSWIIKYPDVIMAEAVLTTKIPPEKIFVKTTGKLQNIFVQNNELVKKNQHLAVIENTANYDDVQFLKSLVDTLKVEKTTFTFPWEQIRPTSLGGIESDYYDFENNYLLYILNLELDPFSNNLSSQKKTLTELNSRLKILESQSAKSRSELELQRTNFQRHKELYEKGVISKMEYEEKQSLLLQSLKSYSNIDYSLSQLREEISNSSYSSKKIEINREIEEKILYTNLIQSLKQLKRSIRKWEIEYLLITNINGVVSYVSHLNVNQKVNQGESIFTVIPKESSDYIGRLKTQAYNSGKLAIDQVVNIKLDNYPHTEYGVITGTINSISSISDNENYYHINVVFPDLITSYNKKVEFKHEMRGDAEIITEDLRLFDRLFYRLKNLASSN